MRKRIAGRSIKESFDYLPTGVCFADGRGIIVLCNREMHRLCHILLGRSLQHIFELREGLQKPKNGLTFVDGAKAILRFPEGEIWEFRESIVEDDRGRSYTQVQALSLTELYTKKTELEEKNRELGETNRRAKILYERLDETVREEEALKLKMRIHSDIGLRLLSTHKALREGGLALLKEEARLWQTQLQLLSVIASPGYDARGEEGEEAESSLRTFLASARDIGVEVSVEGRLPDDREQSYLVICALRENVTNTLRHAKGNEVRAKLSYSEKDFTLTIENNGLAPEKEITEGGGLSGLRRRIEKAGGSMKIESRPRFKLTIKLARKEN